MKNAIFGLQKKKIKEKEIDRKNPTMRSTYNNIFFS